MSRPRVNANTAAPTVAWPAASWQPPRAVIDQSMLPPYAAPPPPPQPPPATAPVHTPAALTALTRVTFAAPAGRVDLAVPVDVPLAEALVAVLAILGDRTEAASGWVLQRIGGGPLDTGRPLAAHGIRDGEVLHLRPSAAPLSAAVFDDPLDAVAATLARHRAPWTPTDTRRGALVAALTALLLGTLLVATAGPPLRAAALFSAGLALLLVLSTAALSRAVADAGCATLAALAVLPYSALAGAFAATDPLVPHPLAATMLCGCAALALGATAAGLALGRHAPLFVGAGTTALVGALAAAADLYLHARPGDIAAVVLCVVTVAVSLLPRVAYRIARIPLPTMATSAAELRAALPPGAAQDVVARALRGDEYLTAFVAVVATAAAGCAVVVGAHGGSGLAILAVAGVVLALRARLFLARMQRQCCLGAAALHAICIIVAVAHRYPQARFVLLASLVGCAAVALGVATRLPGSRPSPAVGRAADVLELLLTVSLPPLTATLVGVIGVGRELVQR